MDEMEIVCPTFEESNASRGMMMAMNGKIFDYKA